MILKKYSYFLKKLTRLWTKVRMHFKRLHIHHTETHLLHPIPYQCYQEKYLKKISSYYINC